MPTTLKQMCSFTQLTNSKILKSNITLAVFISCSGSSCSVADVNFWILNVDLQFTLVVPVIFVPTEASHMTW